MAEVQELKFNSLAERIAALNQQKNFSTPPPGAARRAPPPPPPAKPTPERAPSNTNGVAPSKTPSVPARPQKREAPALPQRTNTSVSVAESTASLPEQGRAPPPPLPGRKTSAQQPSPALPARRTATQPSLNRRDSSSSDVSYISTISNLSINPISRTSTASTDTQPASRRVLAPTLDHAKLPPLPPTRREREAQAAREAQENTGREVLKAPLVSARSAPTVPQVGSTGRPGLSPRLPSRPSRSPNPSQIEEEPSSTAPRRLPPPPSAFVRPASTLGSLPSKPPPIPTNRPAGRKTPPPVPVTSRPTTSQIDAVAVRAAASKAASCLVCRDFSRPDTVAAQYPKDSLPRDDPVGFLATVLCGSFPSHTDKARAIFAWCHHNIAYNVEEFFGKCIKGRDVNETIFMGKAVCQGYAEVFQAIAQRAGLQCIMVVGHGKGYGHEPLAPGQAAPPRDATGHAWNAVCIDHGEWKLVDACWGAGSVGDQKYTKHFKPEMFCISNDRFGLKHFPGDEQHFFRDDGRNPTWEEYIVGPVQVERALFYGNATEEGLSEFTFSPAAKQISVYGGEAVRFQFSKVCEHWTWEKNGKGKPYLLLLDIHGVDGRKKDQVPLETDGFWWWCDVPSRDLGAPGQKVTLLALTVLNKNDARGVTKEEYYRVKRSGAFSMAWAVYCQWELV